jgi:hypothetical protein
MDVDKDVRAKDSSDDRLGMLSSLWKGKRLKRLNKVIMEGYCGLLTVREFVSIVLQDRDNFPRGLDTPMCIGDFEGNFCTNVLSVTVGGENSDHVCVNGDPNGCME